jgi:hypothetical protein
MILPHYRIAASPIAGAGKGLFLAEPVARGRIVVAPDAIPRTFQWSEIESAPDRDALLPSAIRWFEDRYTVCPDWPDECYVNHDFEPNGLWHLGFIFAAVDLAAGDELTIDYRHLLGEGQEEAFRDSRTGERIVGFAWEESLRRSTEALRALLAP